MIKSQICNLIDHLVLKINKKQTTKKNPKIRVEHPKWNDMQIVNKLVAEIRVS